MKKLLVMAVLAMSAFGFAGVGHATDQCASNPGVSLGPCTYGDNNENTCANLWVNTDVTGATCVA